MDFFDKLGKKATKACKVTADKKEKFAKETKFKFRMGELKSKIEDIYEEIGRKVYEKHVKNEEISMNDLLDDCKKIDEMSNEIEKIRKECLELKDKRQCSKCFKEIEKDMKFCPECGEKQEDEDVKEIEIFENTEKIKEQNISKENKEKNNKEQNKNKKSENKKEEIKEQQTNLEKTTQVEINPDAQNITEEELKNIGQ